MGHPQQNEFGRGSNNEEKGKKMMQNTTTEKRRRGAGSGGGGRNHRARGGGGKQGGGPPSNNYSAGRRHQRQHNHRGGYSSGKMSSFPHSSNTRSSIKQSQEMETMLKEAGLLPSDEGSINDHEQLRRGVLNTLDKILCQWCSSLQHSQQLASSSSTDNNKWQTPRVALITFGSYRLKVHRPDSDLDVLALCPPSCIRGDFFTSLVKLLRDNEGVDDMHPIPSAFTPVIKFKLNGIHIDMLFARLADSNKLIQFQQRKPSPLLSSMTTPSKATVSSEESGSSGSIPPRLEYMIDDTDLLSMDEPGVRSLNGVRVTQHILEIVPNVDTFRTTLVAVKEWAVVHGIYSNVLGFLGGINYAILVAWICKRHPHDNPYTLLQVRT